MVWLLRIFQIVTLLFSGVEGCVQENGVAYVLPRSALISTTGTCFTDFYSSAACCDNCGAYGGCLSWSWTQNTCCMYSQIPTVAQKTNQATYISGLLDCSYYGQENCEQIQLTNSATSKLCRYCVDQCQAQAIPCPCSAVSDDNFRIGRGVIPGDIDTLCQIQEFVSPFSEAAASLGVECKLWKAIEGIYNVTRSKSPKHDLIQCWESKVVTAANPFDTDFVLAIANYNISVYTTGPRQTYSSGTMITPAQTNNAQCEGSAFAVGIYDANYEQVVTAAMYEYLLNANANDYNKTINVQSQKVNASYSVANTWSSYRGMIFSQDPTTVTPISTSVSLYVCEMSVISSSEKLVPQYASVLLSPTLIWLLRNMYFLGLD